MSYNLALNSSNVIGINNNTYQYNFPRGNFDIPENTEILLDLLTLPYSFRNISSSLGNNTFTYTMPTSSGSSNFTVTLTDGFYTANDLNNALQATLKSNGHYWYNTNPILFSGTISGTTLTVSGVLTSTTTLPVGSVITGYGVTANSTIVSQASATTYTLSQSSTVSTAIAMSCTNNSEISPQIIYPLSISYNTVNYTTQITSIVIPTTANINSVFGFGWSIASGLDGQSTWSNYPTTGGQCASITIPTTSSSTSTIGNILGFTGGTYPSTVSGYTDPTKQIQVNGNSLSASPPFPAKGSTVNSIVVRCNLIDNPVGYPTDILKTIPITTTYGSNINYTVSGPDSVFVKCKPGKYSSLVISFSDQSFNPLICLDPNVLISIVLKVPKK